MPSSRAGSFLLVSGSCLPDSPRVSRSSQSPALNLLIRSQVILWFPRPLCSHRAGAVEAHLQGFKAKLSRAGRGLEAGLRGGASGGAGFWIARRKP